MIRKLWNKWCYRRHRRLRNHHQEARSYYMKMRADFRGNRSVQALAHAAALKHEKAMHFHHKEMKKYAPQGKEERLRV